MTIIFLYNLIYLQFSEFFRELRERAGLTQRQLGKILNKPQSYIYNCETANRRVDITEFIEWSKGCKISPKEAFRQYLSSVE